MRQFGRLIGSTDMHFGKLSLWGAHGDPARGRSTLAPLYRMLPTNPEPLDLQALVRPLALRFWQRAAAQGTLSGGFRALAAQRAQRLAAAGV